MNRRQFARTLWVGAIGLGMSRVARPFAPEPPQMAITMDDFNWFDAPRLTAEERNGALLEALRAHRVKAAIFVCGRFVDNQTGQKQVSAWDKEGHLIGNHSYSHLHYHNVGFERFSQDMLRGAGVLKQHPQFRKFFRFPYLKEGDTVAKRDKMRAFLKEHGYRNGHVTIDASDWFVDQRLRARLKSNPKSELTPYRDYYLNHLWERALYYNDLSWKVLGHSVKHTLLLHHNVLNGLFLKDVLSMFSNKGWKLIDAQEAFNDPVFSSVPNILPAGESLIWALAKESGKFDRLLRYPGEDSEYEKAQMDKLSL